MDSWSLDGTHNLLLVRSRSTCIAAWQIGPSPTRSPGRTLGVGAAGPVACGMILSVASEVRTLEDPRVICNLVSMGLHYVGERLVYPRSRPS